jgi:hypothetical protein
VNLLKSPVYTSNFPGTTRLNYCSGDNYFGHSTGNFNNVNGAGNFTLLKSLLYKSLLYHGKCRGEFSRAVPGKFESGALMLSKYFNLIRMLDTINYSEK